MLFPSPLAASLLVKLLMVLAVTTTSSVKQVHGLAAPPSSTTATATTPPKSTVVYGPQSRELLLLVSKLAAHQGVGTHCICAPGTEDGCRRLMYGPDYADAGIDSEQNAKPISDPEDMGAALEGTESLILVACDEPVEAASLETFLKYTNPEVLQKIVLLSKMGIAGATGGGGFFGGGGANKKLVESEQDLRNIATDRNLAFSIVRAGNLKGGGPSQDDQGIPLHEATALSKAYYSTILDIVEYKVTLAHDTYSLGADTTSVVAGDPNTMPNIVSQLGNKASFDPSPTDTNRVAVASAAVAALMQPPMELSVGTAAGQKLPTPSEWSDLLQSIQQQ